jgi:hypothetical protein
MSENHGFSNPLTQFDIDAIFEIVKASQDKQKKHGGTTPYSQLCDLILEDSDMDFLLWLSQRAINAAMFKNRKLKMSDASEKPLNSYAIENDINLGRFTAKDNDELFIAYHPLAKLSSHHEANSYAVDAIAMIQKKIETNEFKDKTLSPIFNLLKAYPKAIKTHDDACKFFLWMCSDGKRSNNSNNRYLESLASICPMFKKVPRCKANKVESEKPFTKEEIKKIIDVFDKEFPHYSPFIKFLFSTGCRTSETVALAWDCVDFEAKTITIKESIAIDKDGSKVRKGCISVLQ